MDSYRPARYWLPDARRYSPALIAIGWKGSQRVAARAVLASSTSNSVLLCQVGMYIILNTSNSVLLCQIT